MIRILTFAFALFFSAPALAASCFWVGGTAAWDGSNFTSWAESTGGAGTGCPGVAGIPTSADTVTFDGSSGGGTVTVNTTVDVTSITMGAFTGTLNFATNNNNVTTQTFSITGTGTRTLNMGSGLWSLTSPAAGAAQVWNATTVTNLTFNKNTANIALSNISGTGARSFIGGGLTYNSVSFGSNTSGAGTSITGTNTFATITIIAPNTLTMPTGVTMTATALVAVGGSTGLQFASSGGGTATTLSIVSGTQAITNVALRNITFTGGATFTATGYDLGGNTGITITAPSAGGGGRIIGG